MDIPQEKLLDNSDLYDIPEERRQAIIDAPENVRKEVSNEELDKAYDESFALFEKWTASISEENPEGDREYLAQIQDIIENVDRALAFKYDDVMGIKRQMIFKPVRLQVLDEATLKNRLELH